MQRVLDGGKPDRLTEDKWQIWQGDKQKPLPKTGAWLWPLDVWLASKDRLEARESVGLWLSADAPLDDLQPQAFQACQLIAVYFEKFGDGRGLSTAVLLRERYQYRGALRAIGDVLPDLLDYMSRCGFDSFVLRSDRELKAAEQALSLMEDYYQGSVTDPRPLFKKRTR